MHLQTHLPFPFSNSCLISIQNEKRVKQITCELAESIIEIFQSVNFRAEKDFTNPLVLKFESENVQSYVLTNYSFTVEHICVDMEGKVVKTYFQPACGSKAQFIHAYSSYKFIVLAPPGFIKKHKVSNATNIGFNVIL